MWQEKVRKVEEGKSWKSPEKGRRMTSQALTQYLGEREVHELIPITQRCPGNGKHKPSVLHGSLLRRMPQFIRKMEDLAVPFSLPLDFSQIRDKNKSADVSTLLGLFLLFVGCFSPPSSTCHVCQSSCAHQS